MRIQTAGRLSLLLSAWLSLSLGLMTWIFDIPAERAIPLLFFQFISGFFILYFGLRHMLYSKLQGIWRRIIRLQHFRGSKFTPSDNLYDISVDKLEKWVKKLIKETRTEIDQLKEIAQYRKEFLGNVAHELRTPIFNVQGYLHTLQDGAVEEPEIRDRFLAKSVRSIDNLSDLVEDLMTISKIESGVMQLEKTPFSIHRLVGEVFELYEDSAQEKDIKLGFKDLGAQELIVYADRQKIRQVLENLVVNSIKYGRNGGMTQVGIYDMRRSAMIEISDTGEGIEPKHLERIFERFYRVDKARSRSSKGGTGLGLAIAKHFIDAHGQHLVARSSPGVGSTFSFALEKSDQQEADWIHRTPWSETDAPPGASQKESSRRLHNVGSAWS
jgi:two-component system phosphate regulon sensor histidine kinase PhoR